MSKIRNFILLFILLCTKVIAQNKNEDQNFFINYFKIKNLEIVYSEYQFHDLDKIITVIKQTKTVNKSEYNDFLTKQTLLDSITFSNQELDYVVTEIQNNNDKLWAKNLIPGAIYVSRKHLDKIFNNKTKGREYFEKKYGNTFYNFSKPIFLRENSICFVYIGYACGSLCGNASFDIYIKQNNEWIPYTSLYVWIS